ncbi:MAG TPA: PHB depolymerase family esterase [Dehalococcoidia bacterium]|nr:PHB depolymerase family esterase [Dehalococcoidia bacterium]
MIRALAPLCAAVVLLAVACSGGDGDDGSPSQGPTVVETPSTATGCSPARAAQPGDSVITTTSGGVERTYVLHVPPLYDGAEPVPLVLVLHGFSLTGSFMSGYTLFGEEGDGEGFISVFPNGLGEPQRWNADKTVDQANDVAFLRDLIAKLQSDLCIDSDRIFAAGYSNGGGMAQRLACEAPDTIAAIGTVAATYVECRAPVPWIGFHGTADPLVPFEGGPRPAEAGGGEFYPARRALSEWAREVGCDGLGQISRLSGDVELTTYVRCTLGDGEVLLYTILAGGHTWPGAYDLPVETVGTTSKQIDATKTMWGFFSAHAGTR